jgi:hypothetical protein
MPLWLAVAALFILGRRSATPAASGASAEMRIVQLKPAPGAGLSEASVIEGTLDYRLTNMATSATYEVVPMFSDNRGAGYSFNDAETAERVTVTTPTGRVEIRYPLEREWNDPRLVRPVEIWFFLIERRKAHSRVVATVGPFRY